MLVLCERPKIAAPDIVAVTPLITEYLRRTTPEGLAVIALEVAFATPLVVVFFVPLTITLKSPEGFALTAFVSVEVMNAVEVVPPEPAAADTGARGSVSTAKRSSVTSNRPLVPPGDFPRPSPEREPQRTFDLKPASAERGCRMFECSFFLPTQGRGAQWN